MSETVQSDDRYASWQAQHYDESLAKLASHIRDLADEVEREGRARTTSVDDDGKPDYLWAARQVIHSLHWGVANLRMDGLLSAAADAHSAVRGRVK